MLNKTNVLTDISKAIRNRLLKDYKFTMNEADRDLLVVSFTSLLLLKLLKLEAEKIKVYNRTLQNDIDEVLKEFLKEDTNLKKTDEEKLDDFIHDKDDVGFRKYVPSGTG